MAEGPLVLHRIASEIRMAKFVGQHSILCRLLESRFSAGCYTELVLFSFLRLIVVGQVERLSVRYTAENTITRS